MTSPLISICLPVFNAESTIERCLRNVLEPGIDEVEILVVDNDSTDRTASLAENLLEGKPAARVVRNGKNLGRVGNWNRCLELAEGRYVKFALANDVLFRGSLKVLLEVAEASPGTVMVCSKPRFTDAIPDPPPEMEKDPPAERYGPGEMMRYFGKNGCQTGGLNSMLLLREPVVKGSLLFREDMPYCSDYLHAIQLASKGTTAMIDAESYCFDSSAKGRFHYVGLADARTFFKEQRRCALLLAEQLREHGLDDAEAFDYLFGQYMWYLGQGAPMPFTDALGIFRGHSRYRWLAFQRGMRYQARNKLASLVRKGEDRVL